MSFRSRLVLILCAGPALVLSGCGGGSPGKVAPSGAASSTPAPVAAPSKPTPPDPSIIDPSKRIVEHQIQSGESLWKIARDYKTTVKEIKAANQMADDNIRAGQTLRVPTSLPEGASPGAAAETQPSAPGLPQAAGSQ